MKEERDESQTAPYVIFLGELLRVVVAIEVDFSQGIEDSRVSATCLHEAQAKARST